MRRVPAVVLTLVLIFAPAVASASGFRLMEQDNAGQGMAHAVAASVADAAAVYYNPAAMVEAGEYAAKTGMQFVDPKAEYDGQGTSVETANTTFAIPNLYVVKNYKDHGVAVGLGAFVNFGLGTTWPNDGPFRYVATDTQLRTTTYNLNVAKKFGDSFSAAVGVDYMTSDVRYDAMYPFGFFEPGSHDGYQIMEGSGSGWGYNAAVLFKPAESVKLALTYRSKIKTSISGDIQLLNFPGTLLPLLRAQGISGDDYKSSADVDIEYPDILVFGVAWQASERLLVEADVNYTGWSSYDELSFKFKKPLSTPTGVAILPAKSTTKKNYENTIAYHLGGAYSYNDRLTLRAGYYFDPTPVPDDTFDPRLPDADRNLAAIGFGYKAADNFTVDAAYSYLWTGTRSVDNDIGASTMSTIDGDYKTTTHIFGLSVGYIF